MFPFSLFVVKTSKKNVLGDVIEILKNINKCNNGELHEKFIIVFCLRCEASRKFVLRHETFCQPAKLKASFRSCIASRDFFIARLPAINNGPWKWLIEKALSRRELNRSCQKQANIPLLNVRCIQISQFMFMNIYFSSSTGRAHISTACPPQSEAYTKFASAAVGIAFERQKPFGRLSWTEKFKVGHVWL